MTTAKCSLCKKPATAQYAPFCSKRCADIDLGRWLKGGYSIAGSDSPDSESVQNVDPDKTL
ncbi:MAG: DNA gyrase inhibitor YacG [Alphaproteobacteria bacterium]